MRIKVLNLKIRNFKGISSFDINFDDNTNIYGANATGKTTIFDAYLWCLFGKNHDGKSDFEIKPLDSNNNPIHKLESEVELLLSIDDIHTKLKRVQREKWQKKRGEQNEEFSGNETLLWVDNVPKSSTEYKHCIDNIIKENVFKMLSSPEHFNSLSWNERRVILTTISGNVSNSEIASGNNEFETLLTNLMGKSIEDKKKEITATIRKYKEEIATIPARIDELYRNIPQTSDTNEINSKIDLLNSKIKNIDEAIADKSKQYDLINQFNLNINKEISKLNQDIFNLKQSYISEKLTNIDNENKLFYEKQSDLNKLKNIKFNEIAKRYDNKSLIEKINKILSDLRSDFVLEDAKECNFDTVQLSCPTCKRPFDDIDINLKKEEIKNSFNLQKANKLKDINERGANYKETLLNLQKEFENSDLLIKGYDDKISILQSDLNNYNALSFTFNEDDFAIYPDHVVLKDEIASLNEQIKPMQDNDLSELNSQKLPLYQEIDKLKQQLNNNSIAEKTKARVSELDLQIKTTNQNIADLEKTQFTIDKFIKAKITTVESRINSMFSFVKFKMYNTLVNGNEEPTCETLINGVPYASANAASQKNAGIDIINTLSNYYHVTCPIFLDNAESTNTFIHSECQLIKLFVIEPCPQDEDSKQAYIFNYNLSGKLLL